MFGDELSKSMVAVPKAAVGVVIGKGGDMINQIQSLTGTRIQFKPGQRPSTFQTQKFMIAFHL